ncbi:MAG: PAS domain S-box protein [Desulfobacterales bacterium]|nr:PAS domain S-box protein [Desulfobacterales bacterium]
MTTPSREALQQRIRDLESRLRRYEDAPPQPHTSQSILDIQAGPPPETQFHPSEEKFSTLFYISPVWMDVATVAEGRYIDVNDAFVATTGYAREEVLGRCSTELNLWPHPDARMAVREKFDQQGRLDRHACRFRMKDGSMRDFIWSAEVIEWQGERCALSVVVDTTEIRQAQDALRTSESNFRALTDAAPVAVCIIRDNRFLYVNDAWAAMTGYTREEARRLDALAIVHPDMRAMVGQRAARRLEGDPQPSRYQVKLLPREGKPRWGDLSVAVIRFDGQPAILVMTKDITRQIEAEKHLQASEGRLAEIIDFLPDATWVVDRQGRVVAWNQAIERLTGVAAKAIIGKGGYHHALPFYGEKRPVLIDLVRDAQPHAEVDKHYMRLVREGDTLSSVSFHPDLKPGGVYLAGKASPLYDAEGRVAGAIESLRDITEQKRAEKALRSSEERYREFFTKAPFGIFLSTADGRFVDVNPALAAMLGYDSPREAIDEISNIGEQLFVVPTQREAIMAAALGTKGFHIAEVHYRRRSGEHWLANLHMRAISGQGQETQLFEGFVEEITDRRRAELALKAEKERLRVTLHSIGDAVITTDRAGLITLMNPVAEALTGWSEKEAVSRPLSQVFDIVNERTHEACENPVTTVLSSGRVVALANHTKLISRDGSEYVIADSGAPIMDADRNIIGVVLVFRDVTSERRMQDELRKTEKLKSLGVLAGGIAHDFNNFLAGIVGNLSLAKLDLPPGNPIHTRMDEMEKAALRAKNLTLQLLTFAKGGEPDKRTLYLGDLVRESASFALRGTSIRCRFDIPTDLHTAEVDEGQITQVIHNLMINANQAMPEGGEVSVSGENVTLAADNHLTLPSGAYLRLTVQDAGTGIPPEHLRKVFDPYFTTKQKGSGLGLAVAHSIIEKHAGKLSIYSEMGIGTTIQIYLPAARGKADAPPAVTDEIHRGAGRILVMDDEAFIRTLAEDMLTTLGYTVTTARDGEDAVLRYRKALEKGAPYDAVILDLTIPGGMGGQETISHLRTLDPAVKAIVSSGYSNDPVIANHTCYGFQAAVKKPYLLHEISKALHQLLDAGTED